MKFTFNKQEYELILLMEAGSRLYGTHRQDSDHDIRGIFIAPIETKVGLLNAVKHIIGSKKDTKITQILSESFKKEVLSPHLPEWFEDVHDIELHEIKKFVELASDNNPNILDLLFAPDEKIIYITDKGRQLLSEKMTFLSQKCKFTFSGYAFQQLKRIKGHWKWLSQFPKINDVLLTLEIHYKIGAIGNNFINDVFGGETSRFIQARSEKNVEVGNNEELNLAYYSVNYPEYLKPHVKDYITYFVHGETLPPSSQGKSTPKLHFEHITGIDKMGENTYWVSVSRSRKTGIDIFTTDRNIKKENFQKANPVVKSDIIYNLKVNENDYKVARTKFEQLWMWRCNRNEKRSKLEAKVGYDSKHGSHLVRLLLSCEDILLNGVFNPVLTGKRLEFVRSVLDGEMCYEDLIKYAEDKDAMLTEIYKSKRSKLPHSPNIKQLNKLLIELS